MVIYHVASVFFFVRPQDSCQSIQIMSTHVWRLKDKGRPIRVTWTILARARGFNTSTGVCRLCLVEKFFIMFHRETASLNSRTEIYSSCRHRRGKLSINN